MPPTKRPQHGGELRPSVLSHLAAAKVQHSGTLNLKLRQLKLIRFRGAAGTAYLDLTSRVFTATTCLFP